MFLRACDTSAALSNPTASAISLHSPSSLHAKPVKAVRKQLNGPITAVMWSSLMNSRVSQSDSLPGPEHIRLSSNRRAELQQTFLDSSEREQSDHSQAGLAARLPEERAKQPGSHLTWHRAAEREEVYVSDVLEHACSR
ncbi:hypothetical protein EYF80_015070 [Liparis tanakae]|uniref:Uncharacterized protein n=1 Tax=Liparis tanakae TaxID=230148 RepID=A0A4Z2IBF8_9TELE|nr:hypothetical protein EYF80_015070 [Liparis tanakae]